MNGRSRQQQQKHHSPTKVLYPSPYWLEDTATPPMLRSSWSSSTTSIRSPAATNQHSFIRKQKPTRKVYGCGQNMDQDEEAYTGRHLSQYGISPPRKQQAFDQNYTSAIPKFGAQSQRKQHHNDCQPPLRYTESQSHQPQSQRQHRTSIQHSSPRDALHPIKNSKSNNNNNRNSNNNNNRHSKNTKKEMTPFGKERSQSSRKVSMGKSMNHQVQHDPPSKDEIRIQRKPIQHQRKHPSLSPPPAPLPLIDTTMDISNYHQQQHVGAPAGWKMSSQYDHLILRSPLSSTPPPSLFDGSSSSNSNSSSGNSVSSSMTMSYPSESHQQCSINTNNLIYHRKPASSGGVTGPEKHIHRRTHSRTGATNTASLSGPANLHEMRPSRSASTSHHPLHCSAGKSTSAYSIGTSSQHSYEDQQKSLEFTGERPRRYSQGDCSSNRAPSVASQPHPLVSRRTSTPKLRRVCSAKPCISPPSLPKQQNDDFMNDQFLDAVSLSAAKQQQASTMDSLYSSTGKEGNQHGTDSLEQQQLQVPTFWNPRSTGSAHPVKHTLSRRIRGLLLPQRTKLEDISVSNDQQLTADYQWSVTRPTTPVHDISIDNDAILEDQENGVLDNPFYIISQSWDVVDQSGLNFTEEDFVQMDTYATSVQQIGPSLTPQVLSQKFLVRPYRRDLYRLRIIFMWIIQNIGIVDQRDGPNDSYHQGTGHDKTMTDATHPPPKFSLRQRFTSRRNLTAPDQEEEIEIPAVDVMNGDGLLPEGGGNVDSFDDWLFSESAQQVLRHRICSSSIGMANLFCEMATSVGFSDTRVVYGYLRAPKDSIRTASMDLTNERTNSDDGGDEVTLIQNHAWCYVKVEGEYRFVDCWLASPFQPQNKHKAESTHWFLTKPSHMIYTHFPQEPSNQCLEPTIDVSTFFALPYVWASFFLHHIKMIRYNPDAMSLVDDDHVCHLTFRVDPGIACFAFVETDRFSNHSNQPTTITMRCLAQSRLIPDEKTGLLERVFKIKAILPPGHDGGWLKIYAGASSSATVSHQSFHPLSSSSSSTTTTTTTTTSAATRLDNGSTSTSSSSSSKHPLGSNATTIVPANDSLPPLAVCFRLTASQQERCGNNRVRPFEFVHLHPCRHEFYIREPQCYFLYPLQTYNFLVRGGDDTHHKLAIKSPGGKLYKLMYYPQEHTYDGSVKISETGKWSLISLLHNAGGWYVVASWECRG